MAPAVQGQPGLHGVGQQPDNGPGIGHLWCVDITKTGDLSEELEKGKPNPNNALVWQFGGPAPKGADRDYTFGRSISTCAVHEGLVYAAEYDGFLHCLDAENGQALLGGGPQGEHLGVAAVGRRQGLPAATTTATSTYSPHGKEKKLVSNVDMEDGMKAAPVVANGVLYLLTDKHLFAIGKK